jgi:cell division protein ZapA (FtsZ GTPase activity inhibitor)
MQNVEVRLLGQKIVLKAAGDPDRVKEVAELVTTKLKAAEKRGKGAGTVPHLVALLALFDLAEDLIQAKKRVSEHQGAIETRARELFELVESELK